LWLSLVPSTYFPATPRSPNTLRTVRLDHQRQLAEKLIMSEQKVSRMRVLCVVDVLTNTTPAHTARQNWTVGEKHYNTERFVEPVTITAEGGLKWAV
jgi:hypothetical protein